jgi:type III restriction enzyme
MDQGAHYHRSDLQVHTPRDRAWSGPRPTSDSDRRSYAERFVAACREKDLDAIAITDHHDLCFIDFVREAAGNERGADGNSLREHERLVVFPGIELTLAVPCQALLIFDANLPSNHLHGVLPFLGVENTDHTEPKHPEPEQLPYRSLTELHKRLDERPSLRGRYVVLPNVTDGGTKTLLRANHQANYKDIPCVGGYVDRDASKLGKGARTILSGEDPAWGEEKLAVIQTSDARRSDFRELGDHTTWIKWSRPTAEALRQACLAEESRISLSEPRLPAVAITGIDVSNSRFLGRFELELNSQYNALIGGRGTGKSSCLEYLRWALCDPSADATAADLPDRAQRLGRLIAQTLAPIGAHVTVSFEINGVAHAVRREAKTGSVSLRVDNGAWREASEEEVQALLPIEAYSQRELSVVSVEVEQLIRFVEAPIREDLDVIRTQIDAKDQEIRANFSKLQRARAIAREIARDELALESLDRQVEGVREGLGGLSDEDRNCLNERPGYDEAEAVVENWSSQIQAADEEIEVLRGELSRLRSSLAPLEENIAERELLAELRDEVAKVLSAAEHSVDEAGSALTTAQRKTSAPGKLRERWTKRRTAYRKRYEAATKRSSAHASRLKDLDELEERQRELRSALATNRDDLASLADPAGRDRELRAEWHDLNGTASALIAAQCERLTELSEGLIEARLERAQASSRLIVALRSAFRGTAVRAEKLERFLAEIAAEGDSLAAWQEAMAELDELLASRSAEASKTPQLASKLAFFGGEEIAKLLARVRPEAVLDLSLIPLGDHPVFRYKSAEDEYIDFADASAGQQATALLRVLLNQQGPPLLIDQPEDDLDSQVIEEVVEKIWDAKRHRQLIFASHNANLVVNGDAELLACFGYRRKGDHSAGEIKEQGAIDVPNVKDQITAVMEGGEKAFRLRKAKYGF